MMNKELKTFSENVIKELEDMRKKGTFVPDLAIEQANDLEFLDDYFGMGDSECAELLTSLAQL